EDDRKELALYPDEYDRYGAIVWIQLRKNDKAGAESTLRDWAKANAADPQPLMELSQLLIADKQASAALDAAKEALERAPAGSTNHDATELLLGNAQMQAGMAEQGRATLTELLKKTDNPGMMNDTAYELADAGQELSLDEEKEKTAIERLTAETASWTLDESPETLKQKTSLLLAS